jgi:hypothetical protein
MNQARPATTDRRSKNTNNSCSTCYAESHLTLEEIGGSLIDDCGQKADIGSVWRFFDRDDISFKSTRTAEQNRPDFLQRS